MTRTFSCPECQYQLSTYDVSSGGPIICPRCESVMAEVKYRPVHERQEDDSSNTKSGYQRNRSSPAPLLLVMAGSTVLTVITVVVLLMLNRDREVTAPTDSAGRNAAQAQSGSSSPPNTTPNKTTPGSVQPAEPQLPFKLIAGRPLPGTYIVIGHLEISTKTGSLRSSRTELSGVLDPQKNPIPKGEQATGTTQGFQIGLAPGQIDYEIRPKPGQLLKLEVIMGEPSGFVPGLPKAYVWLNQPHEILDRDRKVIFSSDGKDIGAQREPLTVSSP